MKFRKLYIFIFGTLSFFALPLYAEEQTKFKVGVIAPLSGALTEYGLASKNGIETAIAEHPEYFKNIQFIFEDSQWDAKTALNAFIKLTQADKVNLVYNWGTPTSEALAPVARRVKVPLLSMSSDERITFNNDFTIRTLNKAEDFSRKLANYINMSTHRKIGVIMADNSYVRGLFNGLKKYLSKDIHIEEIASYPIQEQDFKSGIVKIRLKKYDYIGVFLISGQISSFYKQLRQQGVKTPTFGTDFFESSTEIKFAEGGMEGAIYPHLGVSSDFYQRYVAKYNNDYQIAFAGNAYDMAMVMGNLFADSKSLNLSSAEIVDKFKIVSNVSGIGGVFSFLNTPENGPYFHYDVQLKIIENGKVKEIE